MVVENCDQEDGYVMFQNVGATDFYALYLVSFTDKAGDPNTIGMFAPALSWQ